MPTIEEQKQRLLDDFHEGAAEVMHEEAISQKVVADILSVTQPTVSRYFSYTGDLQFPAAWTPLLRREPTKALESFIVRFQSPPFVPALSLNGTIEDEMLNIMAHLGKAVDLMKDEEKARKCMKHLISIREMADEAIAELAAKEGK